MSLDNLADLEVEEIFLWKASQKPALLSKVSDEAFFNSSHKRIFRSMVKQVSEHSLSDGKIDAVALRLQIGDDDKSQLINVARAANSPFSENYAVSVLRDRTIRRAIAKKNIELRESLEDGVDITGICAEINLLSQELTKQEAELPFRTSEDMPKYLSHLEDQNSRNDLFKPSGMNGLDKLLGGGLEPDALMTLAAATGMGKTSFAISMLMAQKEAGHEFKSLLISAEMSWQKIVDKMFESCTNVPKSMRFTENFWSQTIAAVPKIQDVDLIVVDRALSLAGIEEQIIAAKARMGALDFLIIDYLQLMLPEKGRQRHEEIAELTRGLKRFAKAYDLRVIQLSQLNRALEVRSDKRPKLADLRESGSIEQDSDYVVFIYRDEYYDPETYDRGIAEIILAKNRYGPSGKVTAFFENGIFVDKKIYE